MKTLLLIFTLFTLSASAQDADSICTINYEWVLDTATKKVVRMNLDTIEFTEWLITNYEKAGVMFEHAGGKPTKETMWRVRGKPLKGWDVGFTTKEIWLKWYKEINKL